MKTTDWTIWPSAYSMLLNDSILFPENLSLWKAKIDRSRQLFVDDYLIAHMESLERELHAVRKHPKNPVLVADPRYYEADHRCSPDYGHVAWRDPSTYCDLQSGWTYAFITARTNEGPGRTRGCTGLARSRDMVHWEVLPPAYAPRRSFPPIDRYIYCASGLTARALLTQVIPAGSLAKAWAVAPKNPKLETLIPAGNLLAS